MKKFLVYEIKNNINGKSYVGQYSGLSFEKYFGSGKLIKLSIKKYGLENFTKTILEECSNKNELNKKEIFWINKLKTIENGYNLTEGGTGGDLSEFIMYDKNWIENQRHSTKKYWDNISDEERKIRSESVLGEKNGMYGKEGFWKGKKIPKEIVKKSLDNRRSYNKEQNPNWKGGLTYVYCECGKRIGYGNIHCNKCRPRSSENNPFFGKQHSDETKKKLSEKRLGNYNGEQNIPIIIDDIEYRSSGEASKILNIPMVTIRWRVLSKNPKYKNYHYKDEIKTYYSAEEQKVRLSEPQKGKTMTFNKPFIIDDVEYRTLKYASEILNIHPMTIKGRLMSPKFDNYNYKIKNMKTTEKEQIGRELRVDERVCMCYENPKLDLSRLQEGMSDSEFTAICDEFGIPTRTREPM